MRKMKLRASAGGMFAELTTVPDAPGREVGVAAMDPQGQSAADWDKLIGQMHRVTARRSLARTYARMGQ